MSAGAQLDRRSDRQTERRRWVRTLVVLTVLTLAAAGHLWFHYWPRPRALQPSQEMMRLWSTQEAEQALWLAYPHQNLGALEKLVGNLETYLSDLGVALGGDTLPLPRFGPFRFPPAKEIVVAEVDGLPRWRGVAEIYPMVAIAARGAGKLTGNPWLGGGSIDENTEVSWQGNTWRFGTLNVGQVASESSREVIGRLRLQQDLGRWPRGDFDLLIQDLLIQDLPNQSRQDDAQEGRSNRDLWLIAHDATPTPTFAAMDSANSDLALLPLVVRENQVSGQRALAFLNEGEGGIPGVVSCARGLQRWPLPGERLLSRLGLEIAEETVGDWSIAAYLQEDLVQARRRLTEIVGDPATALPSASSFSARIQAGPVSRIAGGLARNLEQIPIIGKRKAEYWWSLSRSLAPLGENGFLEATTGPVPMLRIHSD